MDDLIEEILAGNELGFILDKLLPDEVKEVSRGTSPQMAPHRPG